jgi:predicted amidohydrolase YtcJ
MRALFEGGFAVNFKRMSVFLLALPVSLSAQAPAACSGAELIIHHGSLVTMDADRHTAQAMAVRDGKIIAIGTESQILGCAGPATKIVDLGGKTVLPGLIDVHTHAISWASGLARGDIDFTTGINSIRDIVQQVASRAATTPAGDWIAGFGWSDARLAERRYVTRKDLDAAAPNHPVWLEHVSGHLGVANSMALALAGITRDTATPPGGVIERDSAGALTGIFKDNAMDLVASKLPADPPDLPLRAARMASERAVEVGLTTIHDFVGSNEDIRGYQQALAHGWLKVRVQVVPRVSNVADAEKLAMSGVFTGFGNDRLRFGGVKMFADGGMAARTIAVYPPGPEGEPENLGLLIWKTEDMQKAHHLLAEAGWQLITHAIGDRAMDQVLDSYAAAMKSLNLVEPRFRIVHAGVSTPAIQKRMHDLHVLVDGNPPFVYWIGSWFRRYGAERVRWSYPGKSYIDNGVHAAAGSDVSVTPIRPWWGIWAAVERRELNTGEVLAPEERLTVMQALQLYTRNGAYTGFEENKKGSLEPGKLADFIIIDRDVLTVPSGELKDVQVLATYIGGELVFERKAPPQR